MKVCPAFWVSFYTKLYFMNMLKIISLQKSAERENTQTSGCFYLFWTTLNIVLCDLILGATEIKNPNLKDYLKRHSPLFFFPEISFPGLTIKSTSTFKGDQILIKDRNISLMDCSEETYNTAPRNQDIVS